MVCMRRDIFWRTEGKRRGADLRMRTKVSGMAKSGRRQWQMATSAVRLSKLQGAEVATLAYCTGQIIAISSDYYKCDVRCQIVVLHLQIVVTILAFCTKQDIRSAKYSATCNTQNSPSCERNERNLVRKAQNKTEGSFCKDLSPSGSEFIQLACFHAPLPSCKSPLWHACQNIDSVPV